MVRWKNRTPEDKERVLREQRDMQLKSEELKEQKNPMAALFHLKKTEDNANEIYRRGAIPMPCKRHGWVESVKYEIGMMKHILTGNEEMPAIKGKCPSCGEDMVRAFPTGNEGLLFPLACISLKQRGRLEDKRGL